MLYFYSKYELYIDKVRLAGYADHLVSSHLPEITSDQSKTGLTDSDLVSGGT